VQTLLSGDRRCTFPGSKVVRYIDGAGTEYTDYPPASTLLDHLDSGGLVGQECAADINFLDFIPVFHGIFARI